MTEEENMEDVQNIVKLTSYNDSDWREQTLLKNRELEVKYARQHNQHQLQRAIKTVKQGANWYIRDLFTDIDPVRIEM